MLLEITPYSCLADYSQIHISYRRSRGGIPRIRCRVDSWSYSVFAWVRHQLYIDSITIDYPPVSTLDLYYGLRLAKLSVVSPSSTLGQ